MSGEEGKVHSFLEFKEKVLPRIAAGGYNTIQLMAIQEHPYYGSFGYQVANFFAPSSRFGTPEELKELIDTAHGMGIAVIMDLVHSHAVKNEVEGISKADGSYTLYCHGGARFEHPAWSTRLFDYGKVETLHFLLSNCRYWLEEFRFDGFRFDGVTSMLYFDHGLGRSFDHYDRYFDGNLDPDALAYLTLANELIHSINPNAITVAEDMSGLPGLAAPRKQGGFGFDFRLAMGVPDFWIKVLKERRDEEWNVSEIFWELTNRRKDEKVIAYCESHDQALVGDKTIIFRLADKEMYWSMRLTDESLIIDRAIALHKIIRLLTLSTAGSGYLNFMGNEFGHPEWIDFPREGNNWSYHYARRQWSLVDNSELKFAALGRYDQDIIRLFSKAKILLQSEIVKLYEHIADQVIAYERGHSVFAVNLHGTRSYPGFQCKCQSGEYRVVSCSDDATFGGFSRLDSKRTYHSDGVLSLYLPSRTAVILELA
jgi:1,4-alpha-glucan branching enzyme